MASTDLIVITAASGKQAPSVINHLRDKRQLRLVCASESSLERIRQQWPEAECIMADLTQPREARAVVSGASAVYHIGPSFHQHETEIAYNMIDAASGESQNGAFKHFVLSSVLHTQIRKLLNHECKRYEEEYLIESGLNYTIVKPTTFMQNFPVKMVAEKGHFDALWDPKTPFSFVDLEDLGEASAKVLLERERHYFALYDCCSTGPIPYEQVGQLLSKYIGQDVTVRQMPFEVAVETFKPRILGSDPHPRALDGLERLILYYNRHGLVGSPNVLEYLLGRKANTHADYFAKALS